MDLYWKAVCAALIALLLSLTLEQYGKSFAVLLSVFSICFLLSYALRFFEPIIDFFTKLESLGNLNGTILHVLLKAFGVGLTGEISASVCIDAGNNALGKGIQLLTNAAIFFLSVPVFLVFLDLIQQILTAG